MPTKKTKPLKTHASMPGLLDLGQTPALEPSPELGPTPDLDPTPDLGGFRPMGNLAAPPTFTGATGDDLLKVARSHLGEDYLLGARAPLTHPDWRGPWDCAEFVSWCVMRASGVIYGAEPRHDPMLADAFTGFWARHAESGRHTVPIELAASIPGAAVLRKPVAGQIGHIVFSDGGGGTVEAHNRLRGVIESTLSGRRWDYGILVPGIRYLQSGTILKVKPPKALIRLTQPMTRSDSVRIVQERLAGLGFAVGRPDGIFGPQSAHAVRHFQSVKGLVVDGEVGPATLKAMGLSI